MVSNTTFVSDALKYLNSVPTKAQNTSIKADVSSAASGAPLMAGFEALGNINNYTRKINTVDQLILSNATGEQLAADTTKAGGVFKFLRHPIKTMQALWKGAGAYSAEAKSIVTNGGAIKGNINNSELFRAIKKLDKVAVENAGKLGDDALKEIAKQKEALLKLTKETVEKDVVKTAINSTDDIANAASKSVKTAGKAAGKTGFFKSISNLITKPFKALGSKITSSAAYTHFAQTGVGKMAGKLGKLAKGSGAGFMAIFEGGMELFSEVIPAFKQGGVGSGLKQTGKSTVKVVSSVGGWMAGAAVGAKAGALLGSVWPGPGNIIGGALGFVGGLLGSALFSGIAKKVTGKSEKEKLQEKEIQQEAQAIQQDATMTNDLKTMVAQQVQADIQNGNVSEDTQKMAQYLQELPQSATGTTQQQSFGSLTTNTGATTNPIYSIATNADGSYDFSVPQGAMPQQTTSSQTTNPYAYQDPLLG